MEALKAAARQRMAAGQLQLGLELGGRGGGPLPIRSSRMGRLLDALEGGYRVLGLQDAAGGGEVFRHLVLARIIEPVSKLGSLWVLEEAGVTPVPDGKAAAAGLCAAGAAAAVSRVRPAGRPGAGQPGAL